MVQAERHAEFAVRGRMDIIANILDEARFGAKKTRIMYSCNLSFRQLQAYLDFLMSKNLLSFGDFQTETRIFKTTKKGLAFLDAYDNLQAVISS